MKKLMFADVSPSYLIIIEDIVLLGKINNFYYDKFN